MHDKTLTQGSCPECGASLDYNGALVHEEDSVYYNVSCTACPWKGREYYQPVFIGFTSENGEEECMLPDEDDQPNFYIASQHPQDPLTYVMTLTDGKVLILETEDENGSILIGIYPDMERARHRQGLTVRTSDVKNAAEREKNR